MKRNMLLALFAIGMLGLYACQNTGMAEASWAGVDHKGKLHFLRVTDAFTGTYEIADKSPIYFDWEPVAEYDKITTYFLRNSENGTDSVIVQVRDNKAMITGNMRSVELSRIASVYDDAGYAGHWIGGDRLGNGYSLQINENGGFIFCGHTGLVKDAVMIGKADMKSPLFEGKLSSGLDFSAVLVNDAEMILENSDGNIINLWRIKE